MRALPYTSPEQMAASRRALATCMLALLGLGTVMVYSASFVKQLRRFGADSMSDPFQGHLLKVLVALVIFLLCLRVAPRQLYAAARPAWALGVGLLLLVLVAGTQLNNSRRWFDVAGMSFQPSEVARVATVLMTGAWMASARDRVSRFGQGVLVPFAFVAVPCALVFVEPAEGGGQACERRRPDALMGLLGVFRLRLVGARRGGHDGGEPQRRGLLGSEAFPSGCSRSRGIRGTATTPNSAGSDGHAARTWAATRSLGSLWSVRRSEWPTMT